MKRTERAPRVAEEIDTTPFIRCLMFLDEALKRGVVVGVYEDSREVSDEDIRKALLAVNEHLVETTRLMNECLRAIARVQPGSVSLQ